MKKSPPLLWNFICDSHLWRKKEGKFVVIIHHVLPAVYALCFVCVVCDVSDSAACLYC